MSPHHYRAALTAVAFGLSGAIAGCGQNTAGNVVAAAPGAPTPPNAPPTNPLVVSADPTKTGQAFVEELKQSPALFAKQKQICQGRGAAFQPRVELQAPCAAWDTARSDLEIDQGLRSGGVKNTDSL